MGTRIECKPLCGLLKSIPRFRAASAVLVAADTSQRHLPTSYQSQDSTPCHRSPYGGLESSVWTSKMTADVHHGQASPQTPLDVDPYDRIL